MHDGASARGLGCGFKITQCNQGNTDWSGFAVEEEMWTGMLKI